MRTCYLAFWLRRDVIKEEEEEEEEGGGPRQSRVLACVGAPRSELIFPLQFNLKS